MMSASSQADPLGVQRFMCNICMDVLKTPHITRCCCTLYCEECLNKWFASSPDAEESCPTHCPGDGKEFVHFEDKKLSHEIESQGIREQMVSKMDNVGRCEAAQGGFSCTGTAEAGSDANGDDITSNPTSVSANRLPFGSQSAPVRSSTWKQHVGKWFSLVLVILVCFSPVSGSVCGMEFRGGGVGKLMGVCSVRRSDHSTCAAFLSIKEVLDFHTLGHPHKFDLETRHAPVNDMPKFCSPSDEPFQCDDTQKETPSPARGRTCPIRNALKLLDTDSLVVDPLVLLDVYYRSKTTTNHQNHPTLPPNVTPYILCGDDPLPNLIVWKPLVVVVYLVCTFSSAPKLSPLTLSRNFPTRLFFLCITTSLENLLLVLMLMVCLFYLLIRTGESSSKDKPRFTAEITTPPIQANRDYNETQSVDTGIGSMSTSYTSTGSSVGLPSPSHSSAGVNDDSTQKLLLPVSDSQSSDSSDGTSSLVMNNAPGPLTSATIQSTLQTVNREEAQSHVAMEHDREPPTSLLACDAVDLSSSCASQSSTYTLESKLNTLQHDKLADHMRDRVDSFSSSIDDNISLSGQQDIDQDVHLTTPNRRVDSKLEIDTPLIQQEFLSDITLTASAPRNSNTAGLTTQETADDTPSKGSKAPKDGAIPPKLKRKFYNEYESPPASPKADYHKDINNTVTKGAACLPYTQSTTDTTVCEVSDSPNIHLEQTLSYSTTDEDSIENTNHEIRISDPEPETINTSTVTVENVVDTWKPMLAESISNVTINDEDTLSSSSDYSNLSRLDLESNEETEFSDSEDEESEEYNYRSQIHWQKEIAVSETHPSVPTFVTGKEPIGQMNGDTLGRLTLPQSPGYHGRPTLTTAISIPTSCYLYSSNTLVEGVPIESY